MNELISIIGALFLRIYSIFTHGFVLMKFWYWFLVPVFSSVPEINYIEGVSIFLMTHFFKDGFKSLNGIRDEYHDNEKILVSLIIKPWVMLFVGYIVYLLIKIY